MVKGKQKFPLMLVKLRFRVLFNFSTFVKFVRFPNQNNRKSDQACRHFGQPKKIQRNLQFGPFSYRILWGIQRCILSILFSWAKEVMNENVNEGILCKTKFFTDSVLSVGVLKLVITNINCVAYLYEAKRKTNICVG